MWGDEEGLQISDVDCNLSSIFLRSSGHGEGLDRFHCTLSFAICFCHSPYNFFRIIKRQYCPCSRALCLQCTWWYAVAMLSFWTIGSGFIKSKEFRQPRPYKSKVSLSAVRESTLNGGLSKEHYFDFLNTLTTSFEVPHSPCSKFDHTSDASFNLMAELAFLNLNISMYLDCQNACPGTFIRRETYQRQK